MESCPLAERLSVMLWKGIYSPSLHAAMHDTVKQWSTPWMIYWKGEWKNDGKKEISQETEKMEGLGSSNSNRGDTDGSGGEHFIPHDVR